MTPEQTVAGRDASGCIEQHDNVSALHARGDGAETRLVGLISAPHYQAVLALPGSGIGEPAQLAGRRLGLPAHDERAAVDVRRAAASRGFHSATALSCLFCDEYEEVELAPAGDDAGPYAAEAAALADGERRRDLRRRPARAAPSRVRSVPSRSSTSVVTSTRWCASTRRRRWR